MHPRIELIPGLPLHSYGLMLAIGLLAGLALGVREARRLGFTDDYVYNLAFFVMISAIVGARLFYVFVHYHDQYAGNLLGIFKLWEGGLVFYGGFIGAIMGGSIYLFKKGESFWRSADMALPAVALGIAFGRVGCLMVGCCYGKICPADYPFPLVFPDCTVGQAHVPLYPTQIMSGLNALILFCIMWFVVRKHRPFEGVQAVVFLAYYSISRFIIELYRNRVDDDSMYSLFAFNADKLQNHSEFTERVIDKLLAFGTLTSDGTIVNVELTESQIVGVFMLVLAVILFPVLRKRCSLAEKDS